MPHRARMEFHQIHGHCRAKIKRLQFVDAAPFEHDLWLERAGILFPMFHVKHKIYLMAVFFALAEDVLCDSDTGANGDFQAGFFEKLTGECGGGRFVGFDVAAREVPVVFGGVATEQDFAAVAGDASGDEFNLCHVKHSLLRAHERYNSGYYRRTFMAESNKGAEAVKGRRLGRGLSSLINVSKPVEVASYTEQTQTIQTGMNIAEVGEKIRSEGYQSIAVERVVPSEYQPRRVMDSAAVEGLAASIRRSGLMQPIIVRPIAGGKLELVAGERRWRAAKLAGLTHIPAMVRELTDEDSAEWGLVENVQREDLNPMDRAHALRRLADEFGLTQAQMAERLGIDRSTIANLVRLTELEDEVAMMVSDGRLSGGHARALLMAPAGVRRVALAKQAASNGWSVRRVEEESRRAGEGASEAARVAGANPDPVTYSPREAVVRDIEKRLSQHLGTRVSIRTDRRGTKGQVIVSFFSLDQFDGVLSKLGFSRENY